MTSSRETQTSVYHSNFLKHLINLARQHVPTINGMGITKNEFFVLAAGEKATAMIKKSPMLNYDEIKNEYERVHGAVSEYDDSQVEVADNEAEEVEDSYSKAAKEG